MGVADIPGDVDPREPVGAGAVRQVIEPPAQPLPNFVRGGLKEGFVKTSAYGPAVGDAAKKQADAAKADMMKGGYIIFKGPLKDNKGKEIIAAGKEYGQTDLWLEKMDWLTDGVIGATS